MAKKTTKTEPATDGGENQDNQVQPQAGGPGPDATPNPTAEGASIINSTAGAKATGEEPNLFNSNVEGDKAADSETEQTPVDQTEPAKEEGSSESDQEPTPVETEQEEPKQEESEPQNTKADSTTVFPETGPVRTDVPAQKPTPGRIVNFVPEPGSPEAYNGAEIVPAMIVRVWESGLINLKVFADGPDNTWIGSVSYSETYEPRTWHWPARA